jgi:hypothetical protein
MGKFGNVSPIPARRGEDIAPYHARLGRILKGLKGTVGQPSRRDELQDGRDRGLKATATLTALLYEERGTETHLHYFRKRK